MLETIELHLGQRLYYVDASYGDVLYEVVAASDEAAGEKAPYQLVEPNLKEEVGSECDPEDFTIGTFRLEDGTEFEPSQLPMLASVKRSAQ